MDKGIGNIGVLCGLIVRTIFRKRLDTETQELAHKPNEVADKLILNTSYKSALGAETEVLGKVNNQNARAQEVSAKYFYGIAGGFMTTNPKRKTKNL